MLMHSAYNVAEPASKRAKRVTAEDRVTAAITNSWLELSRLYKSLADYDVLRGIFSSHLGTDARTRRAIEAEMSCDYQTAVKLYTEVNSNFPFFR